MENSMPPSHLRFFGIPFRRTLVCLQLSIFALALLQISTAAAQTTQRPFRPLSKSKLKKTIRLLKPLDKELPEPSPGEWLDQHDEPGQSFSKYSTIRPNVLTRQRNILYIQPIGDFSDTEKKLVRMTAAYLRAYFACEVKTLSTIDVDTIPANARRKHPQWGDSQLLTSYILEKVLAPKLPDNAFATIAFTNQDLWPGDGWNFVFGFAAYRERVGVWSLYRNGDPDESDEAFKKCLWRTVKLATHETGHMFSMRHCTHAVCNMQGGNSLEESDRQPLRLCSQCHAKTIYATGCDPIKRLTALKELCAEYGFDNEVKQYQAAIEKLTP